MLTGTCFKMNTLHLAVAGTVLCIPASRVVLQSILPIAAWTQHAAAAKLQKECHRHPSKEANKNPDRSARQTFVNIICNRRIRESRRRLGMMRLGWC